MKAFNGASGVYIHSLTLSEVHGNQNNNDNQIVEHQDEELNLTECTEYDEFYYIKRGAVRTIKDVHSEPGGCLTNNASSREIETCVHVGKTIFTAEIQGYTNSRFMVVSYNGPDRRRAWKKDFRQFAQIRDGKNMQLFGINRSDVPMLIFHDELVPLGHMWGQLHVLGQAYLSNLAFKLHSSTRKFWVDPKRGVLIRGLEGPGCLQAWWMFIDTDSESEEALVLQNQNQNRDDVFKIAASSTDFLNNDVSWRYFSSLPLDPEFDGRVIWALQSMENRYRVARFNTTTMKCNRPTVVSGLTGDIIAIGSGVWREHREYRQLDFPVLMPDGSTRFAFTNHEDLRIRLISGMPPDERAWLSQASKVFHAHGITLEDDPSQYKLLIPDLWLEGSIEDSDIKRKLREDYLTHSPIYFFIPTPPLSPSLEDNSSVALHFWSSDVTGEARIPNDICESLGLPITLQVVVKMGEEHSWSTETYKDIHRWQVARGFNPTTADFGRYLGYPVLQVICPRLNEPDMLEESSTQIDDEVKAGGTNAGKGDLFWSMLTAPFTYSACEDLDIPVVIL